jgi:hypothetical protein
MVRAPAQRSKGKGEGGGVRSGRAGGRPMRGIA